MKSEKLSNNIIESMFLSSAAVMIATQIIGVVAIIIDGVITGWKLGMEAYLAISLIHPFVTIVLTLAGFISIGNQTRRSSQKREDLLFITENSLYSKIEKVLFNRSYHSLYVQSHERWDEWWDGKGLREDSKFSSPFIGGFTLGRTRSFEVQVESYIITFIISILMKHGIMRLRPIRIIADRAFLV